MTYNLYNKDERIAQFSLKPGEFIPGLDNYTVCNEKIDKDLPFSISTFLSARKPPKHREHIKDVLRLCDIFSIEGLIQCTHLTSLNDTYWVKEEDSELEWKEVSPYRNSFDEVIAKTAFYGGMYGYTFSTTTPELSTSGTFAKCWTRDENGIYLNKKGTDGFANAGLEPYSEYYAQQIMSYFDLPYVTYNLFLEDNQAYTQCELFTSEEIGFRPVSLWSKNIDSVNDVYKLFENYGLEKKLNKMFIIDSVICNEDRHIGNFGFLVNNDTEEIIDMAPLFDHNISFLCYAMNDDLQNVDKYLSNKEHKLIDGNFTDNTKYLVDRDIKKMLRNLKGFQFASHDFYNLPEDRLCILDNLVQGQVNKLLH